MNITCNYYTRARMRFTRYRVTLSDARDGITVEFSFSNNTKRVHQIKEYTTLSCNYKLSSSMGGDIVRMKLVSAQDSTQPLAPIRVRNKPMGDKGSRNQMSKMSYYILDLAMITSTDNISQRSTGICLLLAWSPHRGNRYTCNLHIGLIVPCEESALAEIRPSLACIYRKNKPRV